jgi:hypothetical protein
VLLGDDAENEELGVEDGPPEFAEPVGLADERGSDVVGTVDGPVTTVEDDAVAVLLDPGLVE